MTPLRECCQGCGLPFAHENEMVLYVPGVGTFHDGCERRLTFREWLLYRVTRLLGSRPRGVDMKVSA